MTDAPDDAVDRLYGLPRDAFVAERDALARELRGAGRRDEAAAVKALAKPTVAAWAVNQAVRTQRPAARELWTAGDGLAAAQEAILAGKGSGADLRAATERERAAVEPLVDAARGLLTSSGGDLSEATIERVRETLHAAAIDADAREEVSAGRATRERSPRGLFGAEAVPASPRSTGGGPKKAEREPAPGRSTGGTKPGGTKAGGTKAGGTKAGGTKPRGTKAEGKAATARKGARRERAASGEGRREAAATRKRERDAAAARKREEAAARKLEREEAAARERAHKLAVDRVAKAERALSEAESRSAKAAERLEEARGNERAAVEALADARADLRGLER
jgi:hypothetical protein